MRTARNLHSPYDKETAPPPHGYVLTGEPIRFDMLDFPSAWAIQNAGGLAHHPECSSHPKWRMLCDCGAVIEEWKTLREREGYGEEGNHV